MQVNVVQNADGAASVDFADETFSVDYNEALVHQVVTAYMGRHPTWNEVAEIAGRGARRRNEALASEGTRTGAGREYSQPDLARWWSDIRGKAQELRAEGESQDVSGRNAGDSFRTHSPGAACRGR